MDKLIVYPLFCCFKCCIKFTLFIGWLIGVFNDINVLVPKSNFEYYNAVGQAMFGQIQVKKGNVNVS